MPDANKFDKLREVGYRIPVICGLCLSGQFTCQSMWGHCRRHTYTHGKHTGERDLGVHRYGTCEHARPAEDAAVWIQSYLEFAEWLRSETS